MCSWWEYCGRSETTANVAPAPRPHRHNVGVAISCHLCDTHRPSALDCLPLSSLTAIRAARVTAPCRRAHRGHEARPHTLREQSRLFQQAGIRETLLQVSRKIAAVSWGRKSWIVLVFQLLSGMEVIRYNDCSFSRGQLFSISIFVCVLLSPTFKGVSNLFNKRD